MNQLKKQLAECQAREKVLRAALREALDYVQLPDQIFNIAWTEQVFALPYDSTALDAMLKHAKREALLEAADWFEGTQEHLLHNVFSISFIKTNLRRMAHELQS